MNRVRQQPAPAKIDFSFRGQALAEAQRYGLDSWVFVRELLQNARDAGAGRVELEVVEDDQSERLLCRDDGCGMSALHAHRYLFALYASSKETNRRQAGQFGVGFWSVLRFRPDRVVIRSRPRGGDAWQVELNHRLDNAVFMSCDMPAGTEIVLERLRQRTVSAEGTPSSATARHRPLADKVFDAVWHYGRYLTRCEPRRTWPGRVLHLLGAPRGAPLHVSVNGRSAKADMALGAPSSTFRRHGFRGAVALAYEPRVELFANGLFVRRAACLEDLLEEPAPGDGEGKSSLDLPGSLAPHVILDSSELELLLARSEVRQTRHLAHLVTTAERELERLIERQLEAVGPLPWSLPLRTWLQRLYQRLLRLARARTLWWVAPMAVAGLLAGWSIAGWTAGGALRPPWNTERSAPPPWATTAFGDLPFGLAGGYLSDLGASYRGPRLDPLVADAPRAALSYQPASMDLFLTALIVDDPGTWSQVSNRQPVAERAYDGATCPPTGKDCVAIRLFSAEGDLRLPVPTGHLLDPSSLRRNGEVYPVDATAAGEALVRGVREGDRFDYRTAAAGAVAPERPAPITTLPRLGEIARAIVPASTRHRVRQAVEQVRELVAYDRSPAAVREHQARLAAGYGFAEAALAVGKGDCDVQNGVLVLLLRKIGIRARLAVGYVGSGGRAAPGLHAWVEYLDESRGWRTADASAGSAPAGTSPILWVTGTGSETVSAPSSPEVGRSAAGRNPKPGGLGRLIVRLANDPHTSRAVRGGSIVLGIGLLLLLRVLAARRRSSHDNVRLARTDLAALLGGALQHQGLARLPALTHGRFVPLVSPARGKRRWAISLHEARRLAAEGHLFCSDGDSQLARDAAARGATVIDVATAEGQVTALGLGAVDLDEWSDLLERGTSSGLVDHLNAYLDSISENWRCVLVSPLSRSAKVLDLSRLGLGHRRILIDPRSADFSSVGPGLDLRSDAAAFRLLETVTHHLDMADSERARLLSRLACRAVMEKHGSQVGGVGG